MLSQLGNNILIILKKINLIRTLTKTNIRGRNFDPV